MRALGRIEGILEGVTPLLKDHTKAISELQGAESYRKGQNVFISFATSALVAIAGLFIPRP